LLILKVELIFAEGLAKLVALVAAKLITLLVAEPIFIDGPAPLALLNCLAKSPSMEFSSLKLS